MSGLKVSLRSSRRVRSARLFAQIPNLPRSTGPEASKPRNRRPQFAPLQSATLQSAIRASLGYWCARAQLLARCLACKP
eukprot:6298272-Alexandrium_andersonii.AAC.1